MPSRCCAPAASISTSCAASSASISTTSSPAWSPNRADDAKPTAGFQRVLQRAAIHVQSSGREEVTGANVLVAMFSERESHAVYFLQEQDMTRLDAVNYISHGIAKAPGRSERAACAAPRQPTSDAQRSEKVVKQQARPGRARRPTASTSTRRRPAGKIDPLIGREPEVERTIQILCRRSKNNPLYVGDPGVGKTAIAEGLARTHRRGRGAGRAARTRRSSRSTWARCWPARAIAAISRSG